jgi:hypothetical protein
MGNQVAADFDGLAEKTSEFKFPASIDCYAAVGLAASSACRKSGSLKLSWESSKVAW